MHRPGFRLIELASLLVPSKRRKDWRREWEGETAYAWQRMREAIPPMHLAKLRLRLRVLSCILDALLEAKENVKVTGMMNDLRYALRGLARHPAFSAVAVLTLALGIACTTAVFTLVDGVVIRGLPFEESDRLVALEHLATEGQDELPISPGLYVLYREQASSIDAIAMYYSGQVTLLVGEEAERIPVQVVTPSLFDVLGTQPVQGRAFLPEEGSPGAEPVVILGDALWRRSFGGDPSVMGRTLDMDGVSRRVVGVMPPDFGFPDRTARAWIPYEVDPVQAQLAAFRAPGVARIAGGESVESVRMELQRIITQLPELFPESGAAGFLVGLGLRARVRPLKSAVVGDVSRTLWILLGTVGFVLLIACANVANLLLVRAEARQRELALRLALGAGRRGILGYFMGESVLLALGGGMIGVLLAAWSLRITATVLPADLPRMAEVALDLRVLGFAALVSLGCALFFGLFPLLRFGSVGLATELKDGGGRGSTGGRGRHRLRNALVVVQVAVALVLLVGAGLMFRTFLALRSRDPGFDTERILTARVAVSQAESPDWQETAAFFRNLRERLAGQSGVEAVAFAQFAPLVGQVQFVTISVEDHPRGPDDVPIFSNRVWVSEGYFEALGIRVLEGRGFHGADGAAGTRAVVVSESFARRWWPEVSSLGRRVAAGGPSGEEWWQIVGVVGDVHHGNLVVGPDEIVYFPTTVGSAGTPSTIRTVDVLVRTTGEPLQFLPVLRRELRELNSRVPLSNPRTMESLFSSAMAQTSFAMTMLGTASAIALILGLVGIYGVVSYVVSQRTREIGVRMALGATSHSVRGMVLRQGITLAGVGVGVGLVAAGFLTSLVSSLLFGVSALDPLTFGLVAASLVAVAALASWLPARRASGVDPSRALREE